MQYSQMRQDGDPDEEFRTTFDSVNETVENIAGHLGFARAESMEMNNDPRFFSGNVLDKRLGAFKSLSIVSSLMVGTSVGQAFSLKKDMDFSKYDPLLFGGIPILGCIGWWQFFGFCLQVCVIAMCMTAVYVISHQLFYTFRLLTAGPTGFEQASLFYLNKTNCMWRHFAVKCLLNGLWLFIVSSGITLFCKFYKDAAATKHKFTKIVIMNPEHHNVTAVEDPSEGVDMTVHTCLAYGVMAMFWAAALLLTVIRKHHLAAFRECYSTAKAHSGPLTEAARSMQTRSHRTMLKQGADKYLLDT